MQSVVTEIDERSGSNVGRRERLQYAGLPPSERTTGSGETRARARARAAPYLPEERNTSGIYVGRLYVCTGDLVNTLVV